MSTPRASEKKGVPSANFTKRGSVPVIQSNPSSLGIVDKIKSKMQKIFKESEEEISSSKGATCIASIEGEDDFIKANENYLKEIDELYLARSKEIDEINEKYGFELYKTKEYYEFKSGESPNNTKYTSVLSNKYADLKKAEDKFNEKKNAIKAEYEAKVKLIHEGCVQKRQSVSQSELLQNIKEKINTAFNEQFEAAKQNQLSVSTDKGSAKSKK